MTVDGVIVTGMHRSGTSAVTSVLEAMGLYVGTPEELTAASWENPRGFFERRDLRGICDGLLWGTDADWWQLSGFSVDAIPDSVLAAHRGAFHALTERMHANQPWAIKEPRLCLLLPVFEALARRAVIVQPVRHPLEVARSLMRRNGIPLCAGIALWERYNRAAAVHSRDHVRVTVDYARLVAEPHGECARIVEQLRTAGIGPLDPKAAVARIEPDLHRERAAAASACGVPTGDFVGWPQQALWRAIADNDAAAVEPECSASVDEVLRAYEAEVARARAADRTIRDLRNRESPQSAQGDNNRADELAALQSALEHEQARNHALLASCSWRLTAPLRCVGAVFRGKRRR